MKLTKKILETLTAYFDETQLTLGDMIYHPYKMLHGDLKKLSGASSASQAIKRAEKSGFVKRKIIDETAYVAVTEHGKHELEKLSGKYELDVKLKNRDWDGKYRLILFDVPERNRVIRDTLRSKLKELGFIGWQRSVFIGKEDVTEELRRAIRQAGLEDYVLVIETTDLANIKLKFLLDQT